jgi:FkbM family methyltransferase
MNSGVKMLLRTVQTNFPILLDAKFSFMRRYRNLRRVPFDQDFDGIRLFPVGEGTLFLDVGANRGQSAEAILMMTKGCLLQLFEPNPLLCEKLRRQFRNNRRIAINEFGLGNRTSEESLFVPFYKNWMFDGLASFERDKAHDWLQGRIFFYKKERISLREVQCTIKRLDDLDLAPFLIKLDVQGYEFDVILGGERTLRNHEPVLLIESPPTDDLIAFLGKIGYAFYTFRDNKFIHRIAEGNNTFFMTERKASLVRSHIITATSAQNSRSLR